MYLPSAIITLFIYTLITYMYTAYTVHKEQLNHVANAGVKIVYIYVQCEGAFEAIEDTIAHTMD